jgi:outer membrane protein OmpA-like peptidoglycan-associated protein
LSVRVYDITLLLIALSWSSIAQKSQDDYLIHSIYFGGGSHLVDELQQQQLLEFIQSIDNLDHFEISVHAHTDNIGGKAYNDWLAKQRSKQVIELLEQFSIDPDLISTKAFGVLNPVYDNNTTIGRLKNRRVDIILWPIAL